MPFRRRRLSGVRRRVHLPTKDAVSQCRLSGRHSLRVVPHLARLRSKVQAAGGPQVVAVRGVGYRIVVEDEAPAPAN